MMHYWGEWPDELFAEVGYAADEIGSFLKRYGRINVTTTKEKYGTARVYCSLGWHQLHNITHPGHCYSRYPKWLWSFDVYYGSRIIRQFNRLVVPYHKFLYRLAYKNTIRKYPHIKQEILTGADWPELLEGL